VTSDTSGFSKTQNYDSLDRLVSVTESIPGTPTTRYRYDALDNLTGVCQGGTFDASGNCPAPGRGRAFTYDSLKRLTQANNPESGPVSYTYDLAGNVSTKTDSRGWMTSYSYDNLNRLSGKSYSNSNSQPEGVAAPAVTYLWDTVFIGRLTSASASATANSVASSTQYSIYDAMGRVKQSSQTSNGASYNFSYTYNLAGGLETETYPSNRFVTTCYDAAGRVSKVSGKATPTATATDYTGTADILYAPHGAIQSFTRGDTLAESWSFDPRRLQPTSISVGAAGSPRSAFGMDLYYCSSPGCITNNGNLISANLTIPAVTQSFGYDAGMRLVSATETVGTTEQWGQTYGHDSFGNHWVASNDQPGFTLAAVTPTGTSNFNDRNQLVIQNSGYDATGNLKTLGSYNFVFDAEGRMAGSSTGAGSTTYS